MSNDVFLYNVKSGYCYVLTFYYD